MKKEIVRVPWLCAVAVLAFLGLFAVVAGSPARVEGTNMPGTVVIKHIQNRYGPVTFNHSLHASIAGNCGKCHHHDEKRHSCFASDYQVNGSAVSGCHALKADNFKATAAQGFPSCNGCHRESFPEAPGMPSLKVALHKKCFECHMGMGELGSSPAGCTQMCHAKK